MDFDPTKFGQQLSDHADRIESLEQSRIVPSQPSDSGHQDYFSYPLDPNQRKIIEKLFIFQVKESLQGTTGATAANYTHFFTADRTYNVVSVNEVHATKGTDGSAVSLQLEKLTGTTAPGSGTVLLSTAFDLKGTINTVQNGTLVSSGATNIQKGDRLALKLTGTPTAVASVVVSVYLQYT